MHINKPDARKIETALSELLNREHIDLHEDDRAMLQEALGVILKVTANRAPPQLLEEARNLDSMRRMGDDCEIDDDAGMSDANGGTWVQAWVWVPVPDDADLAEAAEGDICTACARDSLDCSRDPCAAVIEDRAS